MDQFHSVESSIGNTDTHLDFISHVTYLFDDFNFTLALNKQINFAQFKLPAIRAPVVTSLRSFILGAS